MGEFVVVINGNRSVVRWGTTATTEYAPARFVSGCEIWSRGFRHGKLFDKTGLLRAVAIAADMDEQEGDGDNHDKECRNPEPKANFLTCCKLALLVDVKWNEKWLGDNSRCSSDSRCD